MKSVGVTDCKILREYSGNIHFTFVLSYTFSQASYSAHPLTTFSFS